MTFTSEQLTQLDNIYQELGNADMLADHLEELHKLNLTEMRELATRMISQCPKDELHDLTLAINAIRSYTPCEDKPAFHDVLHQALGVKTRILSLTDERNKNPQNMILGDELSVEHFHTFRRLAENLLNDNEVAIAAHLVLKTDIDSLSTLSRKISTLLPDSILASKVQSACSLKRGINSLLLSPNPLSFFTSAEINQQLCVEFSKLFKLVDGKEVAIATQCVINAKDDSEQIKTAVNSILAHSVLAEEIQQALSFNEQLKKMLVTTAPAPFFTDVDIDQCNKFAALLEHQLSGHEQQIGEQLATLDAETRSKIGRTLETITPAAHTQQQCVRKIAEVMQCTVESAADTGPGNNSSSFFRTQSQAEQQADNTVTNKDCCSII